MSCERTRELDLAAFAVERHLPDDRSGWDAFRAHYPTCADCAHEVAAWSGFLAALRPEPDASTGSDVHPDATRLLAFATAPASLPPGLCDAIRSHLTGCGACRSELAVLRGFDFSQLAASADRRRERVGWRALLERVRSVLSSWLVSACAPLPQPALALGVLALLLLPAGFVLWRVLSSRGEVAHPSPPVAHSVPVEPAEPIAPIVPLPSAAPTQPEPPAPERIAAAMPAPPPVVTPSRVVSPREQPRQPVVVARESAPAPAAPSPSDPIRIASLVPSDPPLYDPALALGFGADGMRVTTLIRAGRSELPQIHALGPDHVGVTAEASPVLYWHLSSASPVPVELVLAADDAVDPLLEVTLSPPVRGGLQTLDLAERGIELEPGVTYHWSVSLVPDAERRDTDRVSGVAIRRAPADPELRTRLAAAPTGERAHLLAAAGYWLDAFATLSQWIDAEPDAETLRHHRAALLEQVDLPIQIP